MKKLYGFYTILFTMMILFITGSAVAFFTVDGKGVYGGGRQPGIKANDPFVKAFTNLEDREAVPESLTKSEWEKISASIERDRYRLHKDDLTGAYQAPNFAHGLHATFNREGFQINPRKEGKAWIWGLSLNGYGYGSDLHAVTAAVKIITKDNRIEYHRGDMVEWYINDHRGLEQGFTLKTRPSDRKGSGLLQLQMGTTGNLIPSVEKNGNGITFRDSQGKEVLRYSGLYAFDAAGKKLGARMAADQGGIRLIVEDHEAVYPITIDPFIEGNKLLAGDGAANDAFGLSVSISGDTVIVGAYSDDDDVNGDSGSAYIFSRDQGGANNWGLVQKLIVGNGEYDYFGCSVSISGDTAIVGSYHTGAYIFSRDQGGANNWGLVKHISGSSDFFGYSVSISGDTVIVGASYDDAFSGAAYIFSRDQGGANNWGEVQKLIAGDRAANDYFGIGVSISGDTAIVGAPYDDDKGINSGSAYIFDRNYGSSDNWGQVKKLIAVDGVTNDYFGTGVSISGDTAIVGAYGHDGNGANSGAAYIFSRDQGEANNWGLVKDLTYSDAAATEEFGRSVSISGDTAIVGAPNDDDNGDYSGSAYIFSRDQGSADNWGEVQKLTAGDGAAGDYFGYAVSISGDTVIIGAYKDNSSGSAYIYIVDTDSDGVPDSEERGPDGDDPGYDGNDDTIPDSQQDNVASTHTYNGEDYVTLASSPGTNLSDVQAIAPPTAPPAGVELEYGCFDFTINGVGIGGSASVTLFGPDGANFDTYYKYGPTSGNPAPHWYEFMYDGSTGAVINGNEITLYFVDGQRGDGDLTENGVIIEPGGPAMIQVEDCEGDFEPNGVVDETDLAIFYADFGRSDCGSGEACEGDFGPDADVDGSDLANFAADFGRTDCTIIP